MNLSENMTTLLSAYQGVCLFVILILACCLFACLIRAIKGPRVADRIVAINMMGTIVMVIIAIMAFWLKESYLIDICLIYAMVSFLAVVVLCKIYMGIYEEMKHLYEMEEKEEEEKGE